jgi:hypothetical protein
MLTARGVVGGDRKSSHTALWGHLDRKRHVPDNSLLCRVNVGKEVALCVVPVSILGVARPRVVEQRVVWCV